MPNPTVSILTTCFNRAQYIVECIESVQQSKFQDYEHIIVDDRSSDNSVAIAERYARKDPKIKVFINDKNLGDYPNRNQAAKHAAGKYLKYLDADDAHGEWTTTIMVDAMQQNPQAQIGIVEYQPIHPARPTWLNPEKAFKAYYSNERYFFDASPLNVIMTRKAFEEMGGFTGKRMVGDFEMWQMMAAKHGVLMIPNNLNFYRKHDDQEMTVHAKDPIWAFRYFLISRAQLTDDRNPMSESLRRKHLFTLERKMARTILTSVKNHGLQKANEMRRETAWTWSKVWKSAFS